MTEWEQVALGDVTAQVKRRVAVEPERTYDLLGVRMYGKGAYDRETVTSETSKASHFFRVEPGQFMYNRLFAWGGTFALVDESVRGRWVSNEFPVFECDSDRLLPEYLGLYFQQPEVWAQVEAESTGTTATRNRWKEPQFQRFRLELPPVAVQRRIVDLIAKIDAELEATATEMSAVNVLRSTVRDHLLDAASERGAPITRIGDVIELAYGKPLPERERSGEGSPVLGSNGVVGLHSDAIVEGPGVVVGRKGTAGSVTYVATDFTPIDTTYFVRLLGPEVTSMSFAAAILEYAHLPELSAQTGVPGLNRERAYDQAVPIPDAAEQSVIIRALQGVDRRSTELAVERDALDKLRSEMLSALLTHAVDLPASYDQVVTGVEAR